MCVVFSPAERRQHRTYIRQYETHTRTHSRGFREPEGRVREIRESSVLLGGCIYGIKDFSFFLYFLPLRDDDDDDGILILLFFSL